MTHPTHYPYAYTQLLAKAEEGLNLVRYMSNPYHPRLSVGLELWAEAGFPTGVWSRSVWVPIRVSEAAPYVIGIDYIPLTVGGAA